ncbi:MAG: hypothetical protein JJE09_04145 [Bacteroidia bacterium]|nr:hypothetical protein [Bacteroidia bacterium]
MISWREFSQYPFDRKIRTLYEQASFVVAIRYYGYKINLYLLGQDYVEVFYNHKEDKIEKISLLDSDHSRMKFYYDQIKLPSHLIQ